LANEWFYQKDGREIGPVSSADLRRLASTGELLPTDPVRKADMERWAKASALKGLFSLATASTKTGPAARPAPPAPPPLPKSQAAAQPKAPPPAGTTTAAKTAADARPEEEPESAGSPGKKSTPRWVWYAMAAVVLVGGAGGAYLYIQYQSNQNMSVGPGTMPTQADTGPAVRPESVMSVLDQIRSEKPAVRVMGFRRVLSHKDIPDEDRVEVHKAACDTLADKNQNEAWTVALKVLGRTGTPDDMKLVTPLTTGGGMETQSAALSAAMLISPDDGAKLFEPHAGESAFKGVLSDVVKAGPRCEPALLALLKCDKRVCRYQALGLLGSHGTVRAIDPIKQAKETETDASLMPAYQAAIDGINSRTAKQ